VLHHIDIVKHYQPHLAISEVNLAMTISPPHPTVGLILRSGRASRLETPPRTQGFSAQR
jgi:hypothetical protein